MREADAMVPWLAIGTCLAAVAGARPAGRASQERPAARRLPLQLQGQLVVGGVRLGDGRTLAALVDTGSGNLVVPSAHCESLGCQGHRRFRPEMDGSGRFLGGDAAEVHLAFAGAHLAGGGFEGRVCLGGACGSASFVVAAWLSDSFEHLGFDALLGLGPPRQAVSPEFSLLGRLVQQGVLPQPAFTLSLRRSGRSEIVLGSGELGRGTVVASRAAEDNATVAGNAAAWMPADSAHGEWAVRLQSAALGGRRFLDCAGASGCRAVLDSGCPGIALPDEAFRTLVGMLPALTDCSPEAIGGLPRLQFALGDGAIFDVGPEHYVGVASAGSDGCKYHVQGVGGTSTRTVLLGVPFLLDRDVAFHQGRMSVGITGGKLPESTSPMPPPSASAQAADGTSLAEVGGGPLGAPAGRGSPLALASLGGRLRRPRGRHRSQAAAA